MKHKQKMALLKMNDSSTPGGSATPKNKSSASKKSLSHSAVLGMAGVGVDSSLCFTSKHGKSKDKMKPKIPATPPGTNRLHQKGGVSKPETSQQFINKMCGIPRHSTPGPGTANLPPLPTPKLKIPTPKMKQPEFSTDVLPLPKEDIQEQQERKLQILKKEEKQKELALAVQRGMLGPLGTAFVSPALAVPGHPTDGDALLTPTDLLGKMKERKDKDSKKANKDTRKDKEKRDKQKREMKQEKLFKKKEEKEKRDKEKKEEKKKEKEAKKSKDLMKKDKESKKFKEGKKMKDGKLKERDPLKKEKKEFKKVKKTLVDDRGPSYSVGDGRPMPPLGGPESSVPMLPDDEGSPQPLPVDVINGSSFPMPGQTPLSPPAHDASKSKLCIFKKANKTPKDNNIFGSVDGGKPEIEANFSQSRLLNPDLSQLTDMSAELSGVISSPSIVDTPISSKANRPKKRKKISDVFGVDTSSGAAAVSASPKVKKRKQQQQLQLHDSFGSSPRGRSPKSNMGGSQPLGSSSGVLSMEDGNVSPDDFSGNSTINDERPRTPGGVYGVTSPIPSKCPQTPGTGLPIPHHSDKLAPHHPSTYAFNPPPPGHPAYFQYGSYPSFNNSEFSAPSLDIEVDRPHTPGGKGQLYSLPGIRPPRSPDRALLPLLTSTVPSLDSPGSRSPLLQDTNTSDYVEGSVSDVDRKVGCRDTPQHSTLLSFSSYLGVAYIHYVLYVVYDNY